MEKFISKENFVSPKFVFLSLTRNIYKNKYAAICDILDNCIDEKVKAKNVGVFVYRTKGEKNPRITKIIIYDDGSGMTEEVLYEAIRIGCETGKSGVNSLGLYGVGLKASAISMANNLMVITKTSNGGFIKGHFSLTAFKNDEKKFAGITEANEEDIKQFKTFLGENAEHGTIVVIDDFREVGNTIYNFIDQLKKNIGEVFAHYIAGDEATNHYKVNFFVNNEPVRPAFPEKSCEMVTQKNFSVKGHPNPIKVTTYFVPQGKEIGSDGIERSFNSGGVYIYRNGREVGRGLNYGTAKGTKHSLANCFRAVIDIDGTFDELFGTNFTKVVNDRPLDEIPFELKEMVGFMNEARLECEKKEKSLTKADENDDVVKNLDILKMASTKMAGILEFATLPYGKDKRNGGKHYNTNTGKKHNQTPTHRERKGNCPFIFDFESKSPHDTFYRVEHEDNVLKIIINTKHPYYTYFNGLNDIQKQIEAIRIAVFCYAKHKVDYFTDEDGGFVQSLIDAFEDYISKGYYGLFDMINRKYESSIAI